MRHLATVALCLTLAGPALGQTLDFQQLLSGKEFPLNLKLKDLDANWRHLSIATTDASRGGMGDTLGQLAQAGMMSDMGKNKEKNDLPSAMLGMSLLGGLFGGGDAKEPAYYTKGQTLTLGGETFLLAYRYQKPAMNLFQMAMQAEANGKEPDFSRIASGSKLSADSALALSLINVKTIAGINDIRPFDLNQEIAESAAGGGGGLMGLIAQQAAKEAAAAKAKPIPTAAPGTPGKPGAKPKARP